MLSRNSSSAAESDSDHDDWTHGREDGEDGSVNSQLGRVAADPVFGVEDASNSKRGFLSRGSSLGKCLPCSSQKETPFRFNPAENLRRLKTMKWTVSPSNSYYLLWEQLILVFALYSSIITPFEFAFRPMPSPPLLYTDLTVNVFFAIDLVLTFFVTYKDKKMYTLIEDHKLIATRYLRSLFVVDILSVLPWSSMYKAAGHQGAAAIFRWLLWTRVFRFRHVLEFFKGLQRDIRFSYFAVRISKLLFVEIYVTHVAGCFFYYLATTMAEAESGYTWIGSLTLGNTVYLDFRNMSLFWTYTTSLYWSIVTMATIGYGDIHPVNPREMIFCMVYITFDLILAAYLAGNITALVVKGSNTEKYREQMASLIKYMNRNHLPPALRHQMRQHVRLQFETSQVEDDMLLEFPISLRHKVARALFKRTVERCYLFDGCSLEFINQIVARSTPEYFFPSEIVIQQRDSADIMYLVCSGLVEEVEFDPRTNRETVRELYAGNVFGELAVLCNIPQPFTVRVGQLAQVLRIEKQTLDSMVATCIVDRRKMVDNIVERTKEAGSKFATFSSEIASLITQQEAELTMTTIYAASRGDLDHLKQLIQAGASLTKADYDGRTPLHLAAANGYDDLVRFLFLEGEVDPNCADSFGVTPLLDALRGGHESTAKILVEKGGKLNLQEAGSDLCKAVANGDAALVRRLLSHGVSPNQLDYDHRTPLHVAAAEGFMLVSRHLVEHGADVRAKDRWGATPLDEARRCHCAPLVRYLESVGLGVTQVADAVGGGGGGGREGKADKAGDAVEVVAMEEIAEMETDDALAEAGARVSAAATKPRSTSSPPIAREGRVPGSGPCRAGGGTREGQEETRKRVTLYPHVPWGHSGHPIGRMTWLPSSIDELLEGGSVLFGKKFSRVMTAEGGVVESVELLLDGDKLFLEEVEEGKEKVEDK